MKISCQSCNAKYTIADEKVVGKIVKIRCKKCGATIVINGNDAGAVPAPEESNQDTRVFDYTSGQGNVTEQWTVNVSDGDQRTMTVADLATEYRVGVINDETFCWREGMSDWLPLREIGDLYSAVSAGARPSLTPEQASSDDSSFVNSGGSFGPSSVRPSGNGTNMGALFGGAAPPSQPAAARRAGGRAGGDLFAGVDRAGGDLDVMGGAPLSASGVDEQRPTGQRNENSVLFSLAALTKEAPASEKASAPQGEGSGLIDIRALASASSSKPSGQGARVDDIMNLAGGGAFSPALAAPVLAPPSLSSADLAGGGAGSRGSNKTLIAVILLAAVLVSGTIIFVSLSRKSDKAEPGKEETSAAVPTGVGVSAPASPSLGDSTHGASGDQPGVAIAALPPTAATPNERPDPKAHHTGARGAGGGATRPATEPAAAAALPPPPPPRPKGLDEAIAESGGRAKPSAESVGSSAPFDRGAASAALGAAAQAVASCKRPDGPVGAGHVKVTFLPSGSVSVVDVDQPPFSGTSVGGCVAGKFRGAHVPAFGGSPVSVGKSFTIN